MEARAYRIEAETHGELLAEIDQLTVRAEEDGQFVRVKVSKDDGWWIAVVEVFK